MRGEVGSSKFGGGGALVNTRQEYEGGSQEKEKYLVKSCIIVCPLFIFQCCFAHETQILMTVFDIWIFFLGIISWEGPTFLG